MQPSRHYGAIPTSSQNSVRQASSASHTTKSPDAHPQQAPPDDAWRAKVLITGLRGSGKTSVQEVVFNSLPPKDSFFLESTSRIAKQDIDSIVAFQLWDCPGRLSLDEIGVPLSYFSSIIFVLDIQDDYYQPIAHLVHLIARVAAEHPKVHLEIFIHKAEALSDEFKVEHFQHIQSRIVDELLDHPSSTIMDHLPLNFYLTSVYDHTIYEAFSRVVQRLIPQIAKLENLLNLLVQNSGIAKAFLFDITCLLYVATDVSPVDNASFELCCDYVQTLVSFSNLYKNVKQVSQPKQMSPPTLSRSIPTDGGSRPSTKVSLNADGIADDESPSSSPSHSLISTTKSQRSSPQGTSATLKRTGSHKSSSNGSAATTTGSKTLDRLLPADERAWASSSAKLTPESTLAYWQITDTLSLVCLLRSEMYEERRALIDYNVTFFRGAVHKIVQSELSKRHL